MPLDPTDPSVVSLPDECGQRSNSPHLRNGRGREPDGIPWDGDEPWEDPTWPPNYPNVQKFMEARRGADLGDMGKPKLKYLLNPPKSNRRTASERWRDRIKEALKNG